MVVSLTASFFSTMKSRTYNAFWYMNLFIDIQMSDIVHTFILFTKPPL